LITIINNIVIFSFVTLDPNKAEEILTGTGTQTTTQPQNQNVNSPFSSNTGFKLGGLFLFFF
jgi:hypothetical protein